MRAYYNEIDPYCAEWLKNLIGAGLIADGDVDTRSIAEVTPNDVKSYTQCHFFAGIGGWSGALRSSGVWPDHRKVWTGSCPCQPFSLAGKQGGFGDIRHLWPHWYHLIGICRPAVVLGEQVASASSWLRLVRGDLEGLGYAVGAIPVEAASAGADHLRDRFWFVANRDAPRSQGWHVLPERADQWFVGPDGLADTDSGSIRHESRRRNGACGSGARQHHNDREEYEWAIGADGKTRRVKSGIRLLADGVPCRVAKLRAFGNAIDLRPAAAFIQAVSASL